MPVLSNVRHERFAQGVATGLNQTEAYEQAGYKRDETAASRLSRNVKVQGRIAEITARAATRAEITVASLTERLMKIADVAEKTGIERDEETGLAAKSSSKHLGVARAAIMDAAKLNGLVIDRAMEASVSLEDLIDQLEGQGPAAAGDAGDA